MELQRKLLQSRNTRLRLHNCWKGFEVVLFFLLVNNCIDFRSLAGIAFLQDIKGTSRPACAVMSFLIKNENPLEGKKKKKKEGLTID